jgi:phage terminase large subunit GpA-like protein
MLMERRKPIPAFETGFDIFSRASRLLRPKVPLSVSEWAEKNMPGYDPEALSYLAEIMDALSDPETSEVGDMGPAQAGKSEVGLAWIGWSIDHDPADMLVCQPDKSLMQDFVIRRINPLVSGVPAIKQALLPAANADNMFLKQFRGMLLTSIWPVGSQFRARPVPRGWLDDFDQFDEDIDGQGDAIGLLSARQTTFAGRDTKLISSSPATRAGSNDVSPMEAFVASGTDERLQPICPECGERIEFDLQRDLKFEGSTPDDAAASAHVVCPASGCVLTPTARRALLASLGALPNRGFVTSKPLASKKRRTFRRDGLLGFTTWHDLARQWCDAQIAWETRQDEGPLRAFFNTRAGKNYRSILSGEKPIEEAALAARRELDWRLGTVPPGPKVLNIVVDVQRDRFEVGCVGIAKDREAWLIDRYALHVLDDGLTALRPFVHKEHWKVLLPLFDKKYPLAALDAKGKPIGYAPVLSVTIDTGGSDRDGDSATEGAKAFFEAAVAMGVHPSRITLVKGGSNINQRQLMPPGLFADQKTKGGMKRRSARLWIPNVHKIKNMIDARLRRNAPGPGYLHLPSDLADEYLSEITAEQLEKGRWKKLRPRNETLDILVYAEAAILKPPFAQSRNDTRWIPSAYRVRWPAEGAALEAPTAQADEQISPAEPADNPAKKHRRRPTSRGWMQRLNR